MPKFLSDLTPADWVKLCGIVAISTLFYSDVQGSLKETAKVNVSQDVRMEEINRKLEDALVKQTELTEKMADTLSLMNGSLKAIEAHTIQMDKRIERIERKL